MKVIRKYSRSFILTILMICYFNSFSQQTISSPVIDKFRDYGAKTFQEKLFVHTDKEFYLAGEILWFRIFYVDGSFHKPADLSRIAYLEIFDEKNEAVLQSIISLLPHESNGSLYLPTTLANGNYTLRAYTNWMKNFDSSYFFSKQIIIINTLKKDNKVTTSRADDPVSVRFYPEGGNLVNSIRSNVGFVVNDRNGGITDCKGYLFDTNSDTILSFAPLKFGIGRFAFAPQKGHTYKATVVLQTGRQITVDMPVAFDEGYSMQVNDFNNDDIMVKVKRIGNDVNELMLLAVHSRQVLKFAEQKNIRDGDSVIFVVKRSKLGKGIINFTLFNNLNKPVCERLFFIKPGIESKINVEINKSKYSEREKVNVGIDVMDSAAYSLSMAVYHLDSLQKEPMETIDCYLWLSADLPGSVESPGYYFTNDKDAVVATDNLMLTHGWRRFKWDEVLNKEKRIIRYLPEARGHLISGRITDTRTGLPATSINTYLSVSGHPLGFYLDNSDNTGGVQYEVKDIYGNRQLSAGPLNAKDSFYKVEILKPFTSPVIQQIYPGYNIDESLKNLLVQKSIGMQAQNIYFSDSIRQFSEANLRDTTPFYGKGELVYPLDDYKRFITMEEVLREYVMGINVGVRNGRLFLKVFDPRVRDFYAVNPLVLVDGVPILYPNNILNYDPLKVKRLDVILNRYSSGGYYFSGIASFITYKETFEAYELDPHIVSIDYNGLQLQREFYSPVYDTEEKKAIRVPDFRSTLFWSPDISVNKRQKKSINFYTADRPGTYLVVLQGVSNNGDAISAFSTFEVK